jgi:D-alanine-D-alanine ligase
MRRDRSSSPGDPDSARPRKIRVAVLMGGPSPERNVSLDSGSQVVQALDPAQYDVLPVEITRDGRWLPRPDLLQISAPHGTATEKPRSGRGQAVDPPREHHALPTDAGASPAGPRPPSATGAGTSLISASLGIDEVVGEGAVDVAFIALHGPYGEDGTVQGLLELLGVPYTGSGVLASALAMDKLRSRQVLQATGIPVPAYAVVDGGQWPQTRGEVLARVAQDLGYPCVVKPNAVGSSIGVSIVREEADLPEAIERALEYGDVVLVEEYLRGTELTCAVLEEPDTGLPRALPVIEIVPKREFFDYSAKYEPGNSEEICPARLSADVARTVQQMALRVHRQLGCEGMSRVDMFLSKGNVIVLEANTIPGLTVGSLIPLAARTAGIAFPELCSRVIASALRRDRKRRRIPGSSGKTRRDSPGSGAKNP